MKTLNEKQITNILQYSLLVITLVGASLNVITFMVFMRKKFNNMAFPFYFRILLISDSFILLHSFRVFLDLVFSYNVDLFSIVLCKLNEYSIYVAQSISVWIFCIILLDRLVSIIFGAKMPIFRKRKFQILLVSLVFTYSILFYLPLPLFLEISLTTNSSPIFENETISTFKNCLIITKFEYLIIYWMDFSNLITVTLGINNVLVMITLIYIFRTRKNVQQSDRTAIRDRKFAINSIAVNLLSLICALPMLVLLILGKYLELNQDSIKLIYSLGEFFNDIRYSSTFFVNMCSNSIFYSELTIMVRSRSVVN